MDLSKLCRVCDSEGASNDCTFEELYAVVSKNLIEDASKGVLCWKGNDQPGEELWVGPASMAAEALVDHWVELAYEYLDEEVEEDEITDDDKSRILSEWSGYSEGNPFFIYHYDGSGDPLKAEFVNADGLVSYCVDELESEVCWGLMRTYIWDGYPLEAMHLININTDSPSQFLVADLIPENTPNVDECLEYWDQDLILPFDREVAVGRNSFEDMAWQDYQDELD